MRMQFAIIVPREENASGDFSANSAEAESYSNTPEADSLIHPHFCTFFQFP